MYSNFFLRSFLVCSTALGMEECLPDLEHGVCDLFTSRKESLGQKHDNSEAHVSVPQTEFARCNYPDDMKNFYKHSRDQIRRFLDCVLKNKKSIEGTARVDHVARPLARLILKQFTLIEGIHIEFENVMKNRAIGPLYEIYPDLEPKVQDFVMKYLITQMLDCDKKVRRKGAGNILHELEKNCNNAVTKWSSGVGSQTKDQKTNLDVFIARRFVAGLVKEPEYYWSESQLKERITQDLFDVVCVELERKNICLETLTSKRFSPLLPQNTLSAYNALPETIKGMLQPFADYCIERQKKFYKFGELIKRQISDKLEVESTVRGFLFFLKMAKAKFPNPAGAEEENEIKKTKRDKKKQIKKDYMVVCKKYGKFSDEAVKIYDDYAKSHEKPKKRKRATKEEMARRLKEREITKNII